MALKTYRYNFPVVGIGASAGGLEALEQFFGNMTVDSGMAFVVIQHLDPSRKGIMPELLQRYSNMKVLQAEDQVKVWPNHVYVIPPNKSLSLLNGLLNLFEPVESKGLRLPIDIFFRSLAEERGDKSIGIILSGMGSDGSLGLKSIKEKNGIVLVQDPANAKFDGMPRSAIEAVIPDIVASAEELPGKLINFLKYFPAVKVDPIIDDNKKSDLNKVIILLRELTGHDFSEYKKSTLYRRIERRTGIHQIEKIHNYVRFLQENPMEIEILFKELLIGVTNFFRDPSVWERLKEKVIPEYIDKLPDGYIIRIWVTGCSTGEEAFSWAIILKEVMDLKHKKFNVQIFATDLDLDAVEKARKGVFLKNIDSDVSSDRISRFFNLEGDRYRIKDFIREMVVFAPHNIVKDPPFTKLDILSCRNMLIYMEPELQKRLILLFSYSLKPGGILLLGTSETIGSQIDAFKELDPKKKIYKHNLTASFPNLLELTVPAYRDKPMEIKDKAAAGIPDSIQSLTEKLILDRYVPPSVLVNEKGDILYITGRTGKYLEPVAGKANWNIYAMAREGLRQELPGAFRKALLSFDPVIVHNIAIDNVDSQRINVTVHRIDKPEMMRGMILIVFTDVPAEALSRKLNSKISRRSASSREKELELELKRSFSDLQNLSEENQASQEELKSTNEELQSTNEELQSTNEELTTSKEEMQSMNEELQTVNAELQSKVVVLIQAENDMKNLLNSTEIATVFLDKQLNIRRFTDSVKTIFKLRKTDIGRPITDLVTDLRYPEIEQHAQNVLRNLVPVENSITTNNEKWFIVRIMPYRSLDDHIDGIVITFIDITTSKKLELELKAANTALHSKKP